MNCPCGNRKTAGAGQCLGCNAKRGLRQCKKCRQLLAIALSFGGNARTCIDCRLVDESGVTQEIINKRAGGATTREIAAALGLSQSRVARALGAIGAPGRLPVLSGDWSTKEEAPLVSEFLRTRGAWGRSVYSVTSKDKKELEWLASVLGYGGAVKKWRNSWRLRIPVSGL